MSNTDQIEALRDAIGFLRCLSRAAAHPMVAGKLQRAADRLMEELTEMEYCNDPANNVACVAGASHALSDEA